MVFNFIKGNYRFIFLVSLFSFLNISESYGSFSKENMLDDEEKGIIAKIPNFSQLEKRISDNFNGFENKVQDEIKQKNTFIKETEVGLEEKSNRLKILVKTIDQQSNKIFDSLDQIQIHINDKNRQNIPSEIVLILKKEISGINVPNDDLGYPSTYHDYQKYQQPNPGGYCRTKSSSYLRNVCDEIEKCATDVHNLVYQNSDSVWDMARDSENLAQDVYNHTYGANGVQGIWDIANGFITGDGGIKSKASHVKGQADSIKSKSSSIKSRVDSIKSQISSIKSKVSSLKSDISSYESDSDAKIDNNKSLMQAESWNRAKDYGDIILQKVLDKGRSRIKEVYQITINSAQAKIERVIPVYFDKRDLSNTQSYHYKIEPVQQDLRKIRESSKSIYSSSREIDDLSHQFLHLAKDQHKKIDMNYGALVKKGTQLEETAKGLSKEFLTMTQSLVVVVKDKQEQVQTLKKAEKNLKESFREHENFLIESHEKHVSDLKEQKNEILKIKEEIIGDKLKIVKELEEENNHLKTRMSGYEKRIQEVPLKDQNELKIKMVDSMLEAMMSLLQVDMSDVKSLNVSGPEFAQQCLMKLVQHKK